MKENKTSDLQQSISINLPNFIWQASNFSLKVFITTALITAVHSPLNSMMAFQLRTGRLWPNASHSNLGSLMFMRQFYVGFAALASSTGTRTAYMSGAKKADQNRKGSEEIPHDQTQEPQNTRSRVRTNWMRIGYTMAMAAGDTIACIVPETVSHLKKCEVIGSDFNWRTPYNIAKLSTTTFGARFGFGLINFLCLCEAEELYAKHLPIHDATTQRSVASGLGGVTAAILSYPFAIYRDHHLSKMTVEHGKLISPGAWNMFKQYQEHIKNVGFYSAFKTTLQDFVIQAPLRIARTGTRFAIISLVSSKLGDEPLNDLMQNKHIASGLKHFGLFQEPSEIQSQANSASRPNPR